MRRQLDQQVHLRPLAISLWRPMLPQKWLACVCWRKLVTKQSSCCHSLERVEGPILS